MQIFALYWADVAIRRVATFRVVDFFDASEDAGTQIITYSALVFLRWFGVIVRTKSIANSFTSPDWLLPGYQNILTASSFCSVADSLPRYIRDLAN